MINAEDLKKIAESAREENIQKAYDDRFNLTFVEKKLLEKALMGDPRYTLYCSNLRLPIADGVAKKVSQELIPVLKELGFKCILKCDFDNPYYSHINLHIEWDIFTATDFEREED